MSVGCVGDGLLLCVEGGEVNRKGEDTLSFFSACHYMCESCVG